MALVENLGLVFVAGLITALATGLGALPFFVVDDFSDSWNVGLWGLASGIMVAASVFGLLREGLAYGSPVLLVPGMAAGVVLVVVGHRLVDGIEHSPEQYEEADFRKLVLILGVFTIHSFPEGVAVGVSFGELGLAEAETVGVLGVAVPVLAVFMTVAISIHNVPEASRYLSRCGRYTSANGAWCGGRCSPRSHSPSAPSSRSTSFRSPRSSCRWASGSRRVR